MTSEHVIGRYALFDKVASGGMATVYYGRLLGPVGFARAVAIKQLHPQYSRDHDFVSMFVDEARLTARIRHPNTVPVLDVVKHGRELYIVMEYVLGVSLSELLRTMRQRGERIPPHIGTSIVAGCLHGLHAAHETRDEQGELLGIVHRDVSPSNILVGKDGMARVLDFGIAKAVGRAQVTRHGEIKGKVGYMAIEQLRGGHVTYAADIFAAAVTLWETLTGTRAYVGSDAEAVMEARLDGEMLEPVSSVEPSLARYDEVVSRGMAQAPEDRWPSAHAMAMELERGPLASHADVAAWIDTVCGDTIRLRGSILAELEGSADPSEVRAAIRADLSLDEPSIRVNTWSGSSLDLEQLYEREPHAISSRDDATTREIPSGRPSSQPNEPPNDRPDSRPSAAPDAGDGSVDSMALAQTETKRDARTPAAKASLPIALTSPKSDSATDDSVVRPETSQVVPAVDDDDEPWHDAVARAAASARPVSAAPRPPSPARSNLLIPVILTLSVGGAIALAWFGSDDSAPSTRGESESTGGESESTLGAPEASTPQPTASAQASREQASSDDDTTTRSEDDTTTRSEDDGASASVKPPAAPHRSGAAATARSSEPHTPPAPKSADPFDQLGGRH